MHDLQVERLAERRERVVDLLGELTGRHEDERAGAVRGARAAGEAGEQRQAEGERLARAGLAAAEDVLAGQRVGQRPDLDGERGGHAAPLERGHEALGQAQLAEGRDDLGRGQLGGGVESELELVLDRRRGRGGGGRGTAAGGAPGVRAGLPGGRHRRAPSCDQGSRRVMQRGTLTVEQQVERSTQTTSRAARPREWTALPAVAGINLRGGPDIPPVNRLCTASPVARVAP